LVDDNAEKKKPNKNALFIAISAIFVALRVLMPFLKKRRQKKQ
jgi:hypothetical protein